LRLVVDTNVLVAGLLRPYGPPGRILDSILRQSFTVLYDDRILAEYDGVLARPRFGFDPIAIGIFLAFVRDTGERILAPPLELRCSDPGDQPFLEVAVEGGAAALVTGNRRHFPSASPVRVLTPAELVQLRGEQR
jgi:uncharacterized protein